MIKKILDKRCYSRNFNRYKAKRQVEIFEEYFGCLMYFKY